MADTVLDSHACDRVVTGKRKAWASSKGSCPASEADDTTHTQDHVSEGLPLDVEVGERSMQNEKIATWLKDCRTPMRSLDESYNPAFKGVSLKNGSSFDDDLSLGAEANHLHTGRLQVETACDGLLAEEKRLLFQKRGSMNSTGSGKSSGTVSSVSELLELYEEDPEEILYNLGFGRDEPDIASKVPSRFFISSSSANGIDIKLYLNAQLQRMELENPNYALTSRFRQIEVLTTVANAFSSLYSQVTGIPLQKIGNTTTTTTTTTTSTTTDKETANDVPLLKRRSTVALLKKTISKLNLHSAQTAKDDSTSSHPTETGGSTDLMCTEENAIKHGLKNEQKPVKLFKREPPLLATVKEETSVNLLKSVELPLVSPLCTENDATMADQTPDDHSSQNALCEISALEDISLFSKDSRHSDDESEMTTDKKKQYTSTPEKELYSNIQNPVLVNLTTQQKDSFEIEEVQSLEGEVPHVPASAPSRIGKDQFYRTTSSDSSGFAEDPSSDFHSAYHLQVQEPLRTMGSSGDSNDSETTLTSCAEPINTPSNQDEPFFLERKESEEFQTPSDNLDGMLPLFPGNEPNDLEGKAKTVPSPSEMEHLNQSKCMHMSMPNDSDSNAEVFDTEEALHCKEEDNVLLNDTEQSKESDSEVEIPHYTSHNLPESFDLTEDSCSSVSEELDDLSPSSINKINVALQRAQNRVSRSSAGSPARIGRSMVKASDLFIASNEHSAKNESKIELGYPLRRTRSLPTTLLSPVRVVSSVSVRLTPGRKTLCTPPLYTYRYTPEDDDDDGHEEEDFSSTKSALFTSPDSVAKEPPSRGPLLNKFVDESCHSRVHSLPLHGPRPLSQSAYSLHSIHSEMQEKTVYDHLKTWSSGSVPNVAHHSYATSTFCSPYPQRHCIRPYQMVPVNPPTAIEMQLRRVLHDIRNTVQNLSQYQMFGVNDHAASCCNARASILPLYESTFQELKIMKRSLNLFRSQMMDLELNMLHQQTMVYHHLTEEERQEADQLQYLRNSVRMELQELELQLEERIFAVEEQLRAYQHHSPYRPRIYPSMYECRSLDNLSCSSPLNVLEPVTELLREQTYLKSELGLSEPDVEDTVHGFERIRTYTPSLASELASVCSSPTPLKRPTASTPRYNRESNAIPSPQNKQVFRASVTLTPVPPVRSGKEQPVDICPSKEAAEQAQMGYQTTEYSSSSETHSAEQNIPLTESPGLREVLKEIKQSIVGDLRRELVEGLLAAVSSQDMSPGVKREECP